MFAYKNRIIILWNSTRFYCYSDDPIRSQLCICHDSSAVVACAKVWTDLISIIHEKETLHYNLINTFWNGSVDSQLGTCVTACNTVNMSYDMILKSLIITKLISIHNPTDSDLTKNGSSFLKVTRRMINFSLKWRFHESIRPQSSWILCHLPIPSLRFISGSDSHYNDVIMGAIASQITSLTIATQPFIPAQFKENIKAPRHWPLWGETTGDRWIPLTNGQ